MRTVPFDLNGRTYFLLLNAAALFDIYDQFGTEGSVMDPIKENTRDGFEALCWYLDKLAEQGELFRRWEGHTPAPTPRDGEFRVTLSPLDVLRGKSAVNDALAAGFEQEEKNREERVDLFAAQLQKKTETGSPAPST